MNQEILARVLDSPRLPSLPAIAIEVIGLVQDQNTKIVDIANTIQHDAALSSKILKTVNSSFYGQSKSVGTISQALVILGLNSVKTLALGFSLVTNLHDPSNEAFDHLLYWKRSLYAAVASRLIANSINLPCGEEAFLASLMQDMGMLAMIQALGEEYGQVVVEAGQEHSKLASLEQQRFGLDHAQVGCALGQKWKLPDMLVMPIAYHESPRDCPDEDALALVQCVALGARAADIFVCDMRGPAMKKYYGFCKNWLDISKDRAEPLLDQMHDGTVEMRKLFNLPTGKLENPDEILSSANEALMDLSLQAAQQTDELQLKNQKLQRQATTDSLTGVANRGHFNEFIADQFNQANAQSPLSVLFLDTDHFKKFNDTYGHQLGDKVLVELASVLEKSTPDHALVARYGGEEFAIVLPKTSRLQAAQSAEQVRLAIQTMTIVTDENEPLHVTASIGVATYEGIFFSRMEQVVKAADQAVYAAKEGGRNCVRVFMPRPPSQNEKVA